jgi:uncharacterized membrane protein
VRDILLVLHILAVGTWIGGNVTQFVVTPKLRDRGGAAAAAWMRSVVRMGTRLYTPAAILVLLTGVGLVLDSDLYDFEHAFVVIGVAMVITGGVLGARVFGPRAEEAAAAFEAGDGATGVAVVNRSMRIAVLDSALLVVTVASMVGRWGV